MNLYSSNLCNVSNNTVWNSQAERGEESSSEEEEEEAAGDKKKESGSGTESESESESDDDVGVQILRTDQFLLIYYVVNLSCKT